MAKTIDSYVEELGEIHVPICKTCKKEFELKLTQVDEKTQMGVGKFEPSCNCLK